MTKHGETKIRVIAPEEGRVLGVAGGNYRIIVSGADTNGSYASIEMLVPPGGGPLPHAHPKMQESFYVMEGELTFKTEAGHQKVGEGGFVQIPLNGGIHSFKNDSKEIVRLLCTVMPAGLEDVFTIIGEPVGLGEFLPAAPLTDELKGKLQELESRLGQQIYPSDYLD